MFVTSIFVIAFSVLLEDVLISDLDLAISFPSYCKNTSGFNSTSPAPPKVVALQTIVLSKTHSLFACHNYFE